jgi:hypothetical protein
MILALQKELEQQPNRPPHSARHETPPLGPAIAWAEGSPSGILSELFEIDTWSTIR